MHLTHRVRILASPSRRVALPVGTWPFAAPAASAAPVRRTLRTDHADRVADTRRRHRRRRTCRPANPVLIDAVTGAVAAAAGVGEGAVTAIVVNLTAVNPSGLGHIVVWSGASAKPDASSLNVRFPGHVVANTVTTPVGPGGTIAICSLVDTDVVVDVQGVYVASGATTSGRLELVDHPVRLVDTRAAGGPLAAGATGRVSTVDRRHPRPTRRRRS